MCKLFAVYTISFPFVALVLYALHLAAPSNMPISIFIVVASVVMLGVVFLSGAVMLLKYLGRRRINHG